MPKLPHISGSQTIKILEKMGFQVTRQKGSHIVLRRGTSGCVVPNHKEIKTGTLAGILRQAGISPEEFIKCMNDI
jgi:predicted RNA binding protein YcfA (HicA-like mRNA interferase family)